MIVVVTVVYVAVRLLEEEKEERARRGTGHRPLAFFFLLERGTFPRAPAPIFFSYVFITFSICFN